jgi:polyphosphate kinase 2 (PPK2 family)
MLPRRGATLPDVAREQNGSRRDAIAMGDKSNKRAGARVPKRAYEKELYRLQAELVKMQEWTRTSGARLVVIFEGRDAAGKGGTISRAMTYLNPRFAHVAALPTPTDRERSEWYFQRR